MPFYAAKGRLLPCKTHTFRCWICNLQIINTLRTFRESISNGFQCCCEYIYAGTINRSPTATNGLRKCCWRIAKMWRTPTKYTQNTPQNTNKHSVKYQRSPTKLGANTPSDVGADSSCPYPNIIKYVYSRHQIHVSVSTHTHIHIIEYVYSFHRIRTFTPPHAHFRHPFCGWIRICGHDK